VTAGHTITLLSRPGCHLCDDVRAVIARVAAELGVPWEERDITGSPLDLREYGEMIPVTLIDGVQHDFWRVDERRLRQALGSLSDQAYRSCPPDLARSGPDRTRRRRPPGLARPGPGRPAARPPPAGRLCANVHKGVRCHARA